jgi:peptide/nickel transport system permease protein
MTVATAPGPVRLRMPQDWWQVVPFGLIVLVAIIAVPLVPYGPEAIVASASLPPSTEHWFGTDASGMDVFSRTVAATRINLGIALVVTAVANVLGVLAGLMMGMLESHRGPFGLLARGLGRLLDLLESVPAMLLGLVLVSLYGSAPLTLAVVMIVILVPTPVRLVRTETLKARGDEYLNAARMAGLGEIRLTLRHVLPNVLRPAVENMPVTFAVSLILTAALGFLGVGIPRPTPEWGSMLAGGIGDALVGRWWSSLFPAGALALTVSAMAIAAPVLLGRFTTGRRRRRTRSG